MRGAEPQSWASSFATAYWDDNCTAGDFSESSEDWIGAFTVKGGYGSYVAGVAEVSVSPEGVLKVHKITAATDPGYVVNPAQVERQIAGSFVYGLSAALYGEITVKDGAVEQTNFDSYNVMRMDEMPRVECALVPSGGFWGGVGEPTIMVAAPAVLNAIFAATGEPIRSLPLKNVKIKA